MAPARHSRIELAGLLEGSIASDVAVRAVGDAASDLGISAADLSDDEAFAVLDRIAVRPGLLGIVARFAKSRAILAWRAGKAPR